MRKTVLLISGKAGSGKTTFAGYLKHYLRTGFEAEAEIISFASYLKEVCTTLGWDGNKDKAGRKLLQELGKVVREYDEHFWVRHLYESKIKRLSPDWWNFEEHYYPSIYIIDDWRFPNEANWLRKNAEVDLYFLRMTGRAYDMGDLGNDVSEIALPSSKDRDYYDFIVDNSGSMYFLKEAAWAVTSTMFSKISVINRLERKQ